MPDVTESLNTAQPIGHPPVVVGYVSRSRPAPASFDLPVWVIVPSHSVDRVYGPLAWPAIHGATLPAQGASVWLAFDDNGTPIVLSWVGLHT